MTTDEAITDLKILLANIPKYIRSYRSIEMGVKALKQYGALQEMRQEIEKSRITKNINTTEKMWWNAAIENVIEIIDKHIKEIEE